MRLNMRLPVEEFFLFWLGINAGGTGGDCTALHRKLAGIKPPCVLNMPIPLLRQQY